MLLGHAHPEVLGRGRRAAAQRGTSYGAPTLAEVDLAAAIIDRTPVEQVRLVNSGTEATMSVLRLARGITGRDKIIKFAGCYHGHVDALLAAAGSGVATLAHPGHARASPRRPRPTRSCCPTTTAPAVREAFATYGDRDRRGDHRGRRRQHGRDPARASRTGSGSTRSWPTIWPRSRRAVRSPTR